MRISVSLTTAILAALLTVSAAAAQPSPSATAQPSNPAQKDQLSAANQLFIQGIELYENRQVAKALEVWQQALKQYRVLGDRKQEAATLGNIGTAYYFSGDNQQALAFKQQALAIQQEIGYQAGAVTSLGNIGTLYSDSGQYQQALEAQQQSLALARKIGDRASENRALGHIGEVYNLLDQYELAIEAHQQSWALARQRDDQRAQAKAFRGVGAAYHSLEQYELAIGSFINALELLRGLGDRRSEALTLDSLGNSYRAIDAHEPAIAAYSQALKLHQDSGNRFREARTLANAALTLTNLGKYEASLLLAQQSLALHRELQNPHGEAGALNTLGLTYNAMAEYEQAIEQYQQALEIFRKIGNPTGEAGALGNLGSTYRYLAQYDQAIAFHQQALEIQQDLGDRPAQSITLSNLGNVHQDLQKYGQAIKLHQQSLAISQERNDLRAIAQSIGNLGNLSYLQGLTDQAIEFHNEALATQHLMGDRLGEARSLGNLGTIYNYLEDYASAWELFQQALIIAQDIGDRQIETLTLGKLGFVLEGQGQTELAIAFRKHSVGVSEAIRADIQGLETDIQQSYTESIAYNYRALADLLLEQGRIPEAQQVLDLLKLEELREFSQKTRATWTSEGLQYTAAEQRIIDAHGDLIAFGQTLYNCEQSNCEQLNQLQSQQKDLVQQYDEQVARFEATIQENEDRDRLFNNPDNLSSEAQELLAANPNSALIYPLVTEDKLWLLYATAGGSQGGNVGSIEVKVSQAELSKTVQELGKYLTGEGRLTKLQTVSQQLHSWVVEPLEAALEENEIEHLIFVNDRVTRYIPMAALFDGEQYLLERYTVSSVLSPALTDSTSSLGQIDATQILGLGLTQAVEGFSPLPAVADELDRIVRSDSADPLGTYPGQVHLNDAFTLDRLKADVKDHRVLHIATHANFVPGRPEASYIVLGNGEHWKIPEIDKLGEQLRNLHLVVLSACQTALGGKAEDGTEIAGLSAYFLAEGRAESVIASLWSVNDSSTSLLMQRFYELMASGELTKAEALREAQLSLLYDQTVETRLEQTNRGFQFKPAESDAETESISEAAGLAHPYYWAPFILIGNGL